MEIGTCAMNTIYGVLAAFFLNDAPIAELILEQQCGSDPFDLDAICRFAGITKLKLRNGESPVNGERIAGISAIVGTS